MEYLIAESKFEAVSKKINSIKNKCEKLGLPFKFDVLGEEFVNINDDKFDMYACYRKFIRIDVEGRAYISDYEAVAVASCTPNGNIIRKINHEAEVPERYYNSGCICEHCNSNRVRKEVLIIRNVNTGEYKQVGKACCKLYTGNLDAEWIAMLGTFYDMLEEEERDGMCCRHVGEIYYPLKDVVEASYAIIRKVGYFNSNTELPTKILLASYLREGYTEVNKVLKRNNINIEFDGKDFDDTEEYAENVIQYYTNIKADNDFMRNVSIIIKNGYVSPKELGYICYLPCGYMREVENEEKKRVAAAKRAKSDELGYFGEVGKRYKNEKVSTVEEVAYYATQFGIVTIYRICLESGYELTWKTTTIPHEIDDEDSKINTITFTVKEHGEYKGYKQTLVTRCKFTN